MDALEAISRRRSIRKFTNDPVDEGSVRTLLAAAMSAPSANNQQPWRFVVVTDRETLVALTAVHPYSTPLKEAALAVLICGDTEKLPSAGFWEQDCAAATENLLIAATALGLGSVWLGCHPREDRVKGIQRVLGVPETVIPLALVAVGHPNEEKPKADRYDPEKVHYGRW